MLTRRHALPALLAAALPLVLAAQAPTAVPPKPGAPGAPAAPATPPDPSGLKPFADIVKDAKETKGFFPLHQKDDKVWIEVAADQLEKPFLFSFNLQKGIGERGLYAGMMLDSHMVTFRRTGNTLQFIALNSTFKGGSDKAAGFGVKEGFSESLIASAPVLCKPHPERKSILVDASALFFSDIPAMGMQLEQIYRQSYMLDKGNTSFAKARTTADLTCFSVNAHYMAGRLNLPNPMTPPAMAPSMPSATPDPRSFFLGFYYNLLKLPEQPMAPRAADDRVGYFLTTQHDFSQLTQNDIRQHMIHRWRLEKADPTAAVSKPKQPVVYWLDRNIPEKFRPAVTAGILEWNKAYEKAGIKDAIEVKVQPDDAEWDTLDAKHASIHWINGTDVGFAIGPSHVDPRTGEILDADIGIGEGMVRGQFERFEEEFPKTPSTHLLTGGVGVMGLEAARELAFGSSLLEARGVFEAGSPEAEKFTMEALKDLVTHEVGHTLGLRHNFRASTIRTEAQLKDPAFTKANGLVGSVMEYNGLNIALEGEKQGEYQPSSLGPWDYWVIEYGYKPFEPAKEAEALRKIAERSTEPDLAYGTDEESMGPGGIDPEVNTWDMGPDPMVYAKKRIQLSKELLARLQKRTFKPGETHHLLRRYVGRALGQVGQAVGIATKQFGGLVTLRDHAGTGRPNLMPVAAERQREALRLLEQNVFSMDAFTFKPEFMRRLTIERISYETGFQNPDFSIAGRVQGLQRMALGRTFDPGTAQRILDAGDKLDNPKTAFKLSELYDGVQSAIWAEAKAGKEPSLQRRNLQRDHLRLLSGLVLRATPTTPEDARSLARENLSSLGATLKAAAAKPGLSKEVRAHYNECQSQIAETLKAGLQRTSL